MKRGLEFSAKLTDWERERIFIKSTVSSDWNFNCSWFLIRTVITFIRIAILNSHVQFTVNKFSCNRCFGINFRNNSRKFFFNTDEENMSKFITIRSLPGNISFDNGLAEHLFHIFCSHPGFRFCRFWHRENWFMVILGFSKGRGTMAGQRRTNKSLQSLVVK